MCVQGQNGFIFSVSDLTNKNQLWILFFLWLDLTIMTQSLKFKGFQLLDFGVKHLVTTIFLSFNWRENIFWTIWFKRIIWSYSNIEYKFAVPEYSNCDTIYLNPGVNYEALFLSYIKMKMCLLFLYNNNKSTHFISMHTFCDKVINQCLNKYKLLIYCYILSTVSLNWIWEKNVSNVCCIFLEFISYW